MKAREMQDLLRDVLEELIFARDDEESPLADLAVRTRLISRIATYEDVGLLTENKGLILESGDGSEFQVTIVRSR